ncbi:MULTISPECIES: dephospho-CoA kinase [Marinobacter]|uniref:Dephospho-CoA kinase n=1 Tax=Marinobacter segnicrescens TaxID=430453 RepID=A0A1I0ATI1_9GAMM|nr:MULTISPECIES: dephospho-CoA kinase [Marinobacter]UZD67039.1 dephospho-CoA kinase [Marinobacter sp. AN1]SES97657.1 dephospho-CoA kinase [Marinobacter segnicrescens]
MGKPAVIGLTGGIGSGKSTVAKMFGALGVHWVDADIVAREVVEPGSPALARIAEHFGDHILQPDGNLDRAALRTIVFRDANEREWLEALLHPTIRDELARQLQPDHYDLPYVLLVSPLLLETDQHTLATSAIVVDVPVETQIDRTMSRDDNDREQVERIIAAQMPREHRLSRADYVIRNDQPLAEVEKQVQELHKQLLDSCRG